MFSKYNRQIIKNDCEGTYAYLDNITVGGKSQEEHDKNLQRFLEKYNLTLNKSKRNFSATCIDLLGYRITNGALKPDPERIKLILEIPVPDDLKSLRRVVGMFSYNAQWIPKYSDKIKPLVSAKQLPLADEDVKAFQDLRKILTEITRGVIDRSKPFTIATDASETAISASLNQENKPVAFFSRTLNANELRHSNIEKEATAIVEAIRKWSHFLQCRRFHLITDQKSVSFMFDQRRHSKMKNKKILRWRFELAQYDYDIIYRAGKYNCVPDTLLPSYVASMANTALYNKPFERLSIDFKGFSIDL